MITVRSFRSRVFVLLLGMALVPTAVVLAVGALALAELGSTVGTLGPWDAVAESGRALAESAEAASPGDTVVAAAADAHRSDLSESLRRSRLWTLMSERLVGLLPLAALLITLLLGGLAMLAARTLSRSIAGPIHEIAGWTGDIVRGEPLPAPRDSEEREVTELKMLRGSLRTMASALEDARKREVEGARLRAWTEMARRVAHELKNPLTPMRMAASTLARREDPATEDTVEILMEEIDRLDEMARTFAQFGRMPEGPASEVDLEELVDALARTHGGASEGRATDAGRTHRDGARVGEGRDVRVHAAPDLPRVQGHPDLLARAIRNLLLNALEASDGPVAIYLERRDGHAVVRVRDHGPGIPERLLERIWLPDVTTKRHGTGLGLAMVRQAADAHGGEVFARNHPEGGAEVTIALPTGPTAPGAPVAPTGSPASSSPSS